MIFFLDCFLEQKCVLEQKGLKSATKALKTLYVSYFKNYRVSLTPYEKFLCLTPPLNNKKKSDKIK